MPYCWFILSNKKTSWPRFFNFVELRNFWRWYGLDLEPVLYHAIKQQMTTIPLIHYSAAIKLWIWCMNRLQMLISANNHAWSSTHVLGCRHCAKHHSIPHIWIMYIAVNRMGLFYSIYAIASNLVFQHGIDAKAISMDLIKLKLFSLAQVQQFS